MIELFVIATVYVGSIDGRVEYGIPKQSDVIAAREGYVVGFNDSTHCPDWTMYRLLATNLVNKKIGRTEDFRHDAQVPRSAELGDYKGSGWSRGHMVPAGDMKWSEKAMSESFLLSNIVPQDTRNNSGAWNRIEQQVRNWAMRENGLVVITGPIFDEDSAPRYIGGTKVRVPDFIYKIVFDDSPPRKMIAFIVANRDSKKKPWEFAVSVDEVEEATGMDFFNGLPESEQSTLESSVDLAAWGIGPK